MAPSPAATTGWMPVCTSAPVCSHTAPDGQARSGTPLQYRHWLPKPRQCGDHVGSGYWKTPAGLAGASRPGATGAAGAAGASEGSVGTTTSEVKPSSITASDLGPICLSVLAARLTNRAQPMSTITFLSSVYR